MTVGDRLFLKGYRRMRQGINPELEMLLIYLIVIGVLLWRPRGLFGAATA